MSNTSSRYTNGLQLHDFGFTIITVPIGAFVFSANALLFFVVSTSKNLKDPTYTMITYLMALDCFGAIQYILTFSAPVILQYSNLSSTRIFCKGMYYILCCVLTSSLGLFCGISYYRYRIVIKASQIRSKEKELAIIKRFAFGVCLLSCIIHIIDSYRISFW